jgi:uncharacterized protein YjdB
LTANVLFCPHNPHRERHFIINLVEILLLKKVFNIIIFIVLCLQLHAQSYIISSIAGNGTNGYVSDGVPASSAELSYPKCIFADLSGNIFICDYGNHRIRQINSSGIISTVIGTGTAGYSGDGGAAGSATINAPWGIAIDGAGDTYFSDSLVIRKVNLAGVITTVAGSSSSSGYSGDGGPASAATLNGAKGIALDAVGDLFIADCNNNCIREINASTGVISTIAGNGSAGYSGDGGAATSAQINQPRAVAIDNSGNLYIAGSGARIRKVDPYGTITTLAGNGTVGYSGDGGAATSAQMTNVSTSLCVDNSGNVVFNDSCRIRRISTSGIIGTIAGNGVAGYSGDNGFATSANISSSNFITANTFGTYYFSTNTLSRIRTLSVSSKPYFAGGHVQSLGVCYGSGSNPINSLLSIVDSTVMTSVTWSIARSPAHGSLTAYTTGLTNGGLLTPVGLYYAPSGITTGTDTFKVRITDGVYSDTTTICVTIFTYPTATAITGPTNVCVGSVIALWDTVGGGSWTTSNSSVATISSPYGQVRGIATGSVTISYTDGLSCGTVAKAITVNVIAAPGPFSGVRSFCQSSSTTLSDTTSGGVWSSSNTAVATIGSTGIANGVAAGSSVISYSLSSGCGVSAIVTVNPLPSVPYFSSGGPLVVCIGQSKTLSDSVSGGIWTTLSGMVTLGAYTGIITGDSVGVTTFTFTTLAGCLKAAIVTVNASPGLITGTSAVCMGASITLSDTSSGGLWSATNSLATVGSLSGIVSAISVGRDTIRYTAANGCSSTKAVTVNSLPSAIAGPVNLCQYPVAYTDSLTGGVWSATSGGISIGSLSGIVTPLSVGPAMLSYLLPTGCSVSKVVSVNASPAAISGTGMLCTGNSALLTDSMSGGTWTSTSSAVATVGSSGIVAGVSAGVDTLKYTMSYGCYAFRVLTVDPTPAGPSTSGGHTSLCAGSSLSLTDSTSGGSWLSSSASVAVIGSASGSLTGVSAGSVIISYVLPSGCFASIPVSINPLPPLPTGLPSVCIGATTTISDSVSGGIWSSTTPYFSVGSSTGVVTGIIAGAGTVIYRMPATSCSVDFVVSVNPTPGPISGSVSVCAGDTTVLIDGGGGIWSAATGLVSIGSSTGVVVGVAAGDAIVTYTLPTGCSTTTTFTVLPTPAAITGSPIVCLYGAAALADTSSGGSWLSSDYSVAYISSSGTVIGYSVSSAVISYIAPTGCYALMGVTVNPAPAPISGPTSVCVGNSIILTDGTAGGVWSSASSSVSVSGGMVTGVAIGSATVTYSTGTGCTATYPITIFNPPGTITGTLNVCAGSATLLGDVTTGGTWSAAPAAVGTISSGGLLSGLTSGTVAVTYATSGSCATHAVVTVNPLPAGITGSSSVCAGSSITLSGPAGGTWSAAPTATGTISTAGKLTGITAGRVTVAYTLPTGCATSKAVTVNAPPSVITGPSTVCIGQSITLAGPTGGTWSASGGASVSAGGTVTGITAGVATISYTLPSGCYTTRTVTVSTSAGSISGSTALCMGSTTTLTGSGSGTWSAGGGAVSIGSTSGLVTPVTTGTATVTYTAGSGCSTTETITVNPIPAAITGTGAICPGNTLTLSGPSGGVWSAGAGVSVGSTGMVTGISAGTATISYTLPTGCYRTTTVTVNAAPSAIGGPSALCASNTIYLIESGGGTWSAGGGAVSVGSTSGVVTGLHVGISTVTYTLPTGCSTTETVTVSSSPTAITGLSTLCTGATDTLTDTIGGGVWSVASGAVSVGSLSGVVTGSGTGVAMIDYSLGTGCTVSRTVTVSATPAAITGTTTLCEGTSTTLSDVTTGGVWRGGVGVSVSAGGTVTGITAGVATIDYITGGCYAATQVTVNAAPAAIGGPGTLCAGATVSETESVGGGIWSTSSGAVSIGSTGSLTASPATTVTTAVISYGIGSCSVSRTVTVNPEAGITGPAGLCTGTTITLSDVVSGGTWSAVGGLVSVSAGGTVTGITAGVATVTYTTAAGCRTTAMVTVNNTPGPVTGTLTVCAGGSTTLGNTAGGGTWSSGGGSVSVSAGGTVTGITAGTAPVTYSLGSGCMVYATVTVIAAPAALAGGQVCQGGTTALSAGSLSGGGIWSAGAGLVSVSAGGTVTGVSAGTTTVSYTLPLSYGSGCVALAPVTVNALPDAITGTTTLCEGTSTTLGDATIGGMWSAGVGVSVGSTSGVLTGSTAGAAMVTYTLPGTGCATTATVTISPGPSTITGILAMCAGTGTSLGDAMPGGRWVSDAAGIATVGSASGAVSGLTMGTADITYSIGGCYTTTQVTVTPLPGAILGNHHGCVALPDSLSDATAGGGLWTSSNPLVATAGSVSGVLTGVSPGTVVATYSLGTGCTVSTEVSIDPSPSAITGPTEVCLGATALLHESSTGGAWSAAGGAVSVSAGGTVTGVSGGSGIVSYTSAATGCAAVYAVDVIAVPAISGLHPLCAWGDTLAATDSYGAGTWSSTLVTVGSTGVVLSFGPGVGTVTFTEGHGCHATGSVTINPDPAYITGGTRLCAGATLALADTSHGGVWSATGTAATLGTTGIVTGLSSGSIIVTYTLPATGCLVTQAIAVDVPPADAGTIAGGGSLCSGAALRLTDTIGGGRWSGGAAGVATIGSTTGVVTGVGAGAAGITYTISNECGSVHTTATVTVNASVIPAVTLSATPGEDVCAGTAITFSASATNGGTTPGYTWQVNGGTVSGATSGTYSYTPANGDMVTMELTSSAICATPAMVSSNIITVTVNPELVPVVGITGHPGTTITTGQNDTLTATITNAGTSPTIQWEVNGIPVTGANGTTWIATGLQTGDTVTCEVTSNGTCGGNSTRSGGMGITVQSGSLTPALSKGEGVMVSPNPNKGMLTVKGTIGTTDEDVQMVVTDVLGQTVYTGTAQARGGVLSTEVHLSSTVANGMYLLSLRTAAGTLVFHMAVEQ